jgi:hypothetical protein
MTSNRNSNYDLNESLTIRHLLDEEGYTLKEVADITAASPNVTTRTVNGLRYKFREKSIKNNKGEKVTRSLVGLTSAKDYFEKYGETFISNEDVKNRINEFKSKLVFPTQATKAQ